MKIDSERLRTLRMGKSLSRPQLAKRSGVTERTIQRLENEPQKSRKNREDTLNRLSKALGVEPGVLTGEVPLPEYNNALAADRERVQIGAQVAPRTRLAYDLIKRRYGVSATEIINMAPLFFTLLAEGSLAHRRERLQEADEIIDRLEAIDYDGRFVDTLGLAGRDSTEESSSIDKEEIFSQAFDTSNSNQFASYLYKLTADLEIPGVVQVTDLGNLHFGRPMVHPDYDICRDELDRLANGSAKAKGALETGHVRVSQIPEELMKEDAGEERENWLKSKLPNFYKELSEEDWEIFIEYVGKDPSEKLKKFLEEADSQETDSAVAEKGDDK